MLVSVPAGAQVNQPDKLPPTGAVRKVYSQESGVCNGDYSVRSSPWLRNLHLSLDVLMLGTNSRPNKLSP